MNELPETIPAPLREIIEDFGYCEGQEKLEYLLEFAVKMPHMPAHLLEQRDKMVTVPECITPIYIHAEADGNTIRYLFDVPESSPTVRGFAGILHEGVQGCTAEAILQIPIDFYLATGLDKVLSPQRMNGMRAILGYMKHLAANLLAPSA